MRKPIIYCCFVLVTLVAISGCMKRSDNEVVVYSALDREFAEPILDDLELELGLKVKALFDQESNKTVGMVSRIIQNQERPNCDVFWNNEIMHTMRLQNLGLLEVYQSPQAEYFPQHFVSSKKQWHGFAARARVLIVNTDLLPDPQQRPNSIYDLANPKWKGRCAMARPLFGTTATHAAVLFAELGEEKATKFMQQIAANAKIEGGNKQVALKVASGQYAFGITDTDDAVIELEQAKPIAIVFPDQAASQLGTMLIPNTLAIIKNGPNPTRAKLLVNRLLEPDIETRLAQGKSAQIPINRKVTFGSRVKPNTGELRIMKADFAAAAEKWELASKILMEIFPPGG